MGLFSSKSKSKSTTTTNTTYTDQSSKVSGTVGDLSKNNVIAGGDAVINGYSADDTKSIIDAAIDNIKETSTAALNQVASAYSGANNSILESQNATKAFLASFKPYAFYAMVAAIVYFIFDRKGKK